MCRAELVLPQSWFFLFSWSESIHIRSRQLLLSSLPRLVDTMPDMPFIEVQATIPGGSSAVSDGSSAVSSTASGSSATVSSSASEHAFSREDATLLHSAASAAFAEAK
jgi:hypothetical protein